MTEKLLTVKEMARMGGLARAKRHSKNQIRKWGRLGGRPHKLNAKQLEKLQNWLKAGNTQAWCAQSLSVSARTVGRAVREFRRG